MYICLVYLPLPRLAYQGWTPRDDDVAVSWVLENAGLRLSNSHVERKLVISIVIPSDAQNPGCQGGGGWKLQRTSNIRLMSSHFVAKRLTLLSSAVSSSHHTMALHSKVLLRRLVDVAPRSVNGDRQGPDFAPQAAHNLVASNPTLLLEPNGSHDPFVLENAPAIGPDGELYRGEK